VRPTRSPCRKSSRASSAATRYVPLILTPFPLVLATLAAALTRFLLDIQALADDKGMPTYLRMALRDCVATGVLVEGLKQTYTLARLPVAEAPALIAATAADPCPVCGGKMVMNVARHMGTPVRCAAGHIWGGTCGHSGMCAHTPVPQSAGTQAGEAAKAPECKAAKETKWLSDMAALEADLFVRPARPAGGEAQGKTPESDQAGRTEATARDPCPLCGKKGFAIARHAGVAVRCDNGHKWGSSCGHAECASTPIPSRAPAAVDRCRCRGGLNCCCGPAFPAADRCRCRGGPNCCCGPAFAAVLAAK
jgi:hypothetical protein